MYFNSMGASKMRMNTKGAASMGRAIAFVFLLLVLIALVPTIFHSATGLGNTSIFGGAPTYVYTLVALASAVGVVKLVIGSR